MSKQVNIRLSDKMYGALESKADIYGMNVAEYVRSIIVDDLKTYMEKQHERSEEHE